MNGAEFLFATHRFAYAGGSRLACATAVRTTRLCGDAIAKSFQLQGGGVFSYFNFFSFKNCVNLFEKVNKNIKIVN